MNIEYKWAKKEHQIWNNLYFESLIEYWIWLMGLGWCGCVVCFMLQSHFKLCYCPMCNHWRFYFWSTDTFSTSDLFNKFLLQFWKRRWYSNITYLLLCNIRTRFTFTSAWATCLRIQMQFTFCLHLIHYRTIFFQY